jgi:transglutaminase-like putative cysteine protease
MSFQGSFVYEKVPFLPFRIPRPIPETSLPLRICVAFPVVISFLALLREENWPPWGIWIVFGTIVGFWISWMRCEKRNWWVRFLLAIAMIFAGGLGLLNIINSPYDPRVPLANLLMWLQLIHSFDMPSRIDLSYSILVSLILMALAAVFSNSLVFGIFLLFYFFFVIFALLFVSYREAVERSRFVSSVAFSAVLKFLFASSIPLVGFTLLIGFLLFLFVPRTQGFSFHMTPFVIRIPQIPMFHGNVANPGYPMAPPASSPLLVLRKAYGHFDPNAYFGFNPLLDLRVRGVLSNTLVMRVKSQEPGYWRGLAFDKYNGEGWTISKSTSVPMQLVDNTIDLTHADINYPRTHRVLQSFYIETQLPNLLFSLYPPDTIYFPSDILYRGLGDSIRLPFYLEPGTVYTVISEIPEDITKALKESSYLYPPQIKALYLQLPSELPLRVRLLARKIVKGKYTPYEKVKAILDWLHQFPYSLDIPPPPTGRDAVDHFLFDLKKGYCEQFASAFAVLARCVGIPVRLVTGYSTGTFNPFTLSYEVREKDAHAWDEVYFSHIGWIPVDPSPPYPEIPVSNEKESPFFAGMFFRYLTALFQTQVSESMRLALKSILEVFLGALFVFVFILVWREGRNFKKISFYIPIRLKKQGTDGVREKLFRIYRRFEKKLSQTGEKRKAWETPLEWVERVTVKPEGDMALDFVKLYLQGRFSKEDLVPDVAMKAEELFKKWEEALTFKRRML